jgi:dTDP-L-rhamnose 4-epimerase
MNNILITGGAGFIGSKLALYLIERGNIITVLDNLSPQIHGEDPSTSQLYLSIRDKVRFIRGTVTSESDWIKALDGQDIVVHFAAETGTGQSMYCIDKYINVNIRGTAIMLDLLANRKHSIKKIVVASSRAIYGEGKYFHPTLGFVYPKNRLEKDMISGDFEVKYNCDSGLKLVATDEESLIHPSSIYGITKQNQEQMVMTVCPTLGISAVAFRYQNVYGPGQSLSNPYTGILSIFSTQIRNGNMIQIFEDGLESRDFVFIDDVVRATYLGIVKEEANDHVFNVGSGISVDVLTVANTLIEAYNINVPISITGKFRMGDIRHNVADISKIDKYLGFKPATNFKVGMEMFTNWVLCQKIEKDNLQISLNELKSKGLLK